MSLNDNQENNDNGKICTSRSACQRLKYEEHMIDKHNIGARGGVTYPDFLLLGVTESFFNSFRSAGIQNGVVRDAPNVREGVMEKFALFVCATKSDEPRAKIIIL